MRHLKETACAKMKGNGNRAYEIIYENGKVGLYMILINNNVKCNCQYLKKIKRLRRLTTDLSDECKMHETYTELLKYDLS